MIKGARTHNVSPDPAVCVSVQTLSRAGRKSARAHARENIGRREVDREWRRTGQKKAKRML